MVSYSEGVEMTLHEQELVNQMCKIVEVTVNGNEMTKHNKEWYLNTSWKIIVGYIKECNAKTTKEN